MRLVKQRSLMPDGKIPVTGDTKVQDLDEVSLPPIFMRASSAKASITGHLPTTKRRDLPPLSIMIRRTYSSQYTCTRSVLGEKIVLPLLLKALQRGGVTGLDLLRREPFFQVATDLVGSHYLVERDNIF